MRTGVVVIHGVGDPQYGVMAKAVAENLRGASRLEGNFIVAECNWNQIVEKPLEDGLLRFSAFRDIAICLERATQIQSRFEPQGAWASRLSRLADLCLKLSEASLAAALGSLLILAPVLAAFALLTSAIPGGTVSKVAIAWNLSRLCTAALGLSCLALLTVGALLGITQRSWGPFALALRRIVLVLCRPAIAAAFYFLSVPWNKARRFIAQLFLLAIPGSIAISLFIALLFKILQRPFELHEAILGALSPIGVVAALFVLIMVPSFAVVAVAGPVLKILLDIFRYVGQPEYRTHIQTHLDSVIERLRTRQGCERFCLVAHSLGSVISLDSLISSPVWKATDSVVLITLGSPVRRLFMRFFPDVFFPSGVDAAAAAMAGRVAELRWINCYRFFDQIGAALGFRKGSPAIDAGTGQWWRFLSAHTDYWSDPAVRETVLAALGRSAPLSGGKERERDYSARAFDPTHGRRISEAFFKLTVAAALLLPFLALAQTVAAYVGYRGVLKERLERLQTQGVHALADIEHMQEVTPSGGQSPPTVTEHLRFYYPSITAPRAIRDGSSGFEEADFLLDADRLIEFVRARCQDTSGRPPIRWNLDRLSRWCRRSGIPILYDRTDPTFFVVEGFPAHRTLWDEISAWGLQIFMSLMVALVLSIILLATVGQWLALLAGADPSTNPGPPTAPEGSTPTGRS